MRATRINPYFAVCLAVILTFVAECAWSRPYKLWGGQVSFELPKEAKTRLTPADANFPDEFLVTPAGATKNVVAFVARERLPAKDISLPFAKYAQKRKAQFTGAEGVRLVRFSTDPKLQRVRIEIAGRLPDWVPVPLKRETNAKVLGYLTTYRSGRYAFGAFAITTDKNWRAPRIAPYRRLVDSLRVRK
jgi:hypothetical protein